MQIQYVKTPAGEELAILPRAELEAMMAATAHVQALHEYQAGRDPGLTADEMRALLAAASPLAFWRRKRRLTQAALAAEAGLTQNYLSDLETGKREGSPAQWLKIARALQLPLEELIVEA